MKTTLGNAISAVALCLGLVTPTAQAVSTTNTYNGSIVTTNKYIISPSGGNEVVELWTNGAQLTVVTNVLMQPSGAGSKAVLLFDGSTNTQMPGVAVNFQTAAGAGATSIVSLVNNSLMTYSPDPGAGFGLHIGDGAGYNLLVLSNSTFRVQGGGTGPFSVGYAGNVRGVFNMESSLLDMGTNKLALQFGWNAGAYGIGAINNSTLTNLGGFYVGASAGLGGVVTISNSTVDINYTLGAARWNVGGTSNAVLTLDRSAMQVRAGSGVFTDIASAANTTGTVNVVNGSVFTQFTLNRAIQVGSGGYGTLNVTNAAVIFAFGGSDIDPGIGTAANSKGFVNLFNGTNLFEHSIIIGKTGGTGSYTADGSSYVQVNYTNRPGGNLVIGQDAGSTGTFTVAGASQILATNAAHNSTILAGQNGRGTFVLNGGTTTADQVLVTNGPSSVLQLNAGQLFVSKLTMGAGSIFGVGMTGTNVLSQYGQIVTTNSVILSNSVLRFTMGYAPAPGDTYTLIDNQGSNPLFGQFVGYTNNSFVDGSSGGFDAYFHIQYTGGTGNDLVLVATIPEPSALLLGAGGVLMLAGMRRRMRRCRW